ncbi:MAG: HEAT repeat domain-containing protein [Thermoguttaceae bacterium]
MFRKFQPLIVALAMLAAAVGAAKAFGQNSELPLQSGQDAQQETDKCLAIIKSADASDNDKAVAFKRLAVFGTRYAVAELAPLLEDAKWAHYVRYSLEPLPDGAVDETFRAALEKLQGNLLVGVINSIGVRQDPEAVPALVKLLDREDDIVAAATAALGKIATKEAVDALKVQLAKTQGNLKIQVADACLACADKLLALNDKAGALDMLDTVRKADVPIFVVEAATQNAILAQGEAGIPLLVEQLKSDDARLRGVALRAARLIAGEAVAQALLGLVEQAPPDQQAKLLTALADRGDAAALPAVVKAAGSQVEELRLAAIEALVRLGGADNVGLLLEAAADPDEDIAAAARQVLVAMPGAEVDAAVVAAVAGSQGKALALAIETAGERRIMAASEALEKAAQSADPQIQTAAVRALGETVGLDKLPGLIDRLVRAKSDEEKAVLEEAIKDTVIRMPDEDACAAVIAQRIQTAPAEVKVFLTDRLLDISGQTALKTVVAMARSNDPAMQDKATEALGNWVSADAAPELYQLAKDLKDEKYKIRALRGYIRIARQLNPSEEERMEICRNTLAIAERIDEKKLVMEVVGRYPSAAALQIAVSATGDAEMRENACQVAIAIAEKIVATDKAAVAQAMETVAAKTRNAGRSARAKELAAQAK